MYQETKEAARLYQLLSEKLGNDTAEAIFKYIDNKTGRVVQSITQALATKDELALNRKKMLAIKTETIRLMFIFWIGQFAGIVAIMTMLLKK